MEGITGRKERQRMKDKEEWAGRKRKEARRKRYRRKRTNESKARKKDEQKMGQDGKNGWKTSKK
jgi:hypothetical protein